MWLSDTAVKRPVVAIVLSLLLCVFGLVSFSKLSVREMPDVQNPVVTVMTTYSGASATIMESKITKNLEDELTGISGIDEITSTTRNGMSRISIKFELGWDLTEGVSDVRDAVAKAQRRLPDEANDPIVSKDNGTGEPSIYVNLSSENMDRTQLTDYAQRVLEDRFSLITGVSSVNISGGLYKVMYVQLKPQLMAGRNVTTNDIISALNTENLETPGGEVRNDTTVMSVRTKRLYYSPEDFNYLVVHTADDGTPIYLKDVASVFVGAENENSTFKSNGIVNLSLGIVPQSDANPLDISTRVQQEVDKVQSFLPEGTKLIVDYDANVFIARSINEVYNTLFITGVLVILVLYIFIGQVRATLIPAVTVPVSLIAAFIAAYSLGYSINLLTLMALILAIGLVVDDAIVVVENIFHHIEQGEEPILAAYKGTREVGFAVISTTLVLVMVFLPISFMDGMVGLLFTEFSVMLAMSVLFSSLIALTLTPVMSSKLLKANVKKNRFNIAIDNGFARMERGYRRLVKWALRWRIAAPLIIIACIGGSYMLMQQVPSQLSPQEDRGVLFAFIKGAEGTSYNRMIANMDIVESRLMPLLGQGVVKSFSVEAPAFGGRAGDQTGFAIIQLEDWQDRDTNIKQALALIAQTLKDIPDVMVRPMLPGFRGQSSEPVQFVLGGSDYSELFKWAQVLQQEADASPMLSGADLDYAETTPELVVTVDKQRAAELGISVEEISTTLEIMLGGRKETTFVERGEEYDVYLRGDENSFNSITDLSKIYFRSSRGQLITLDTVTHVEEVASPQRLSHTNKQKSITIKANLGEGYTLGEALDFLEQRAITLLPSDISIAYTGESKDFKENQSGVMIVFGLALLIAYLVLAAQFESFINPAVVMFTVPMGIFGGFIGLVLTHQGMNIYSQIGMIMLIGMVTKNGILIVEFANQLRDRGLSLDNAIIDASARRLRPILMTAFTTLIGAIPLIVSTGAGSESRIAVGTVIFFGMAFATMVTLLVIPAMYRLISSSTHSPGFVEEQLNNAIAAQQAQKP
ncbi:efflux RND transporter permease subunit [Shewanella sp. SR43-4]|jgi:HAE1 family hydrophobic/amphiphilic exporter-1|uniref:multidrug efflux RND transporter permease subunit n=1 Tax=Shewanella TaxID=22 RepID=UPI000C6BFC21|nr:MULTISPECIES: multidrug efflux RND transporter permease subunit [Shewanella]NCQ45669.1 efflux RND transporter permease subunit [Shewanella frigidimarina]MBB1318008.1 efflux RND transporter permease subunit [Shewanella sp. SR43-4]MBB1320316.1 efflux RND transporter permease subunit [Shewanella sp. SR43-8]MBB1388725.1 efflux RND transporter permease subunit [Shewanella sp. SG44-6]NCO71806.1 efflux RND transporter permease subunit [Shewanella vesiculosa]|tara:strand:+ start:403 stop:3507 length:3105 start_codon:yes stop_codon:yes gene_type:complete